MEYTNFLKITLSLQKESRKLNKFYELGLDIANMFDPYHSIISVLIEEIYGKEGLDWFDWFCFENDFGQGGLTAYDKDKNPIVYSHESLWKLLESDYKIK